MQLLLILNHKPDDGTDVAWNALRLAEAARKAGMTVKVFLMNEAVDLGRPGLAPAADYDLQGMLREGVAQGAEVKLCKSCLTRCGLGGGSLIPEAKVGTMPELVEWIAASDRVLTF